MSIENCINELTAAIKELTAVVVLESLGGDTQVCAQKQSTGMMMCPVLAIPALADMTPQKSKDKPKAPREATSSLAQQVTQGMTPEAPSEPPAKVALATYEDAATVLVRKEKTARKALIKTFKESAEKLVDLSDMGEDIWARVIEASKDLPEKS